MAGKPTEKLEKDNQEVWDWWWKFYSEKGEDAKEFTKQYYANKVYAVTRFQPSTIIRKINEMLRNRPKPCY